MRSCEDRRRDGEAKRLGGLEVDDELNLGDLLDRQIARLLALDDPARVEARRSRGGLPDG